VKLPAAARAVPSLLSLLSLLALLSLCPSCGGGGRDVIPESRDVTSSGAAPARNDEGYEYVARRPLAVVALAEARGVDAPVARAAVEQIADRLDACATEQGRKGTLARGAARVLARIEGDGSVAAVTLRVDPGAGVASTAVLCLVAPTKLLTFPAANGVDRGLAIEAIWGQIAH
jgi:hypothetical protein